MAKRDFVVAVVGATGAVGEKMRKYLEERSFPVKELRLLASKRSAGQTLPFRGEEIVIQEATPEAFEGVDIALFSAGGSVSKQLAPEAAKRGAVVIDNSSAFRMDENVPLVVPEVNRHVLPTHKGIIANPNCSTIQMVVALKPLYDRYGIERVIVSTYQAVSGAGAKAVEDLYQQTEAFIKGEKVEPKILPVGILPKKTQIAFNAIPQIDVGQENGYTFEEMKMVMETKKILEDEQVGVTATCVRLPIVQGHSESVYVELASEYNLEEVRALLADSPGLIVQDDITNQVYPTPLETANTPDTYVGRIRRDLTHPNGLNLWVVSDNLLKGAATNAIQIAEALVEDEIVK
ncbi:aspartate-semialdehyde dehydrogenase [Risungbinella massiliensis]|uniref:aspartate-semialdehyde dehydrogenase n=1 Tax=Risungbinella massiliensis TaxID=1329796 RepID=UPI0005CB92B0|nr:aspartate-semialdehyde dehydrogenase [Risungbinella massiliensis]